MTGRLKDWRLWLALFFCASLALAPAIAEARAGHSYGSRPSSMGSRGLRTVTPNGGQPLSRTLTPSAGGLRQPAPSPAYGGSFFHRHPFLTGLAGGFIGSWLFGHSGFSGAGMLLQLLVIGLLIYFVIRLFRARALSSGALYSGPLVFPRSAGAAAPAPDQGRELSVADSDLNAFQALHAGIQEAWSAADLVRMRPLMTPEMLSYFADELTRNTSQGVHNIIADVELLKGDLSEAWEEEDRQFATALLRWRALDYVVRLGRSAGDPDYLVGGDPRTPVEAEEMWTFVRSRGGTWLLSAIQQV